jgi:hypothetical protein
MQNGGQPGGQAVSLKPPIIVDNYGDMMVFESLTKAESYLEPIDIRNGEYIVFDSGGHILKQSVIKDFKGRERVALTLEQDYKWEGDKLKTVLIRFLSQVLKSNQSLETLSLEQLVEMIIEFKTY